MIGIITVIAALGIVGLLVWGTIRCMLPMPPNARLLLDLWASQEESDAGRRQTAGGQAGHFGGKEGKMDV